MKLKRKITFKHFTCIRSVEKQFSKLSKTYPLSIQNVSDKRVTIGRLLAIIADREPTEPALQPLWGWRHVGPVAHDFCHCTKIKIFKNFEIFKSFWTIRKILNNYLIAFSVDSICSGFESPRPMGPSMIWARTVRYSFNEPDASAGPLLARMPTP